MEDQTHSIICFIPTFSRHFLRSTVASNRNLRGYKSPICPPVFFSRSVFTYYRAQEPDLVQSDVLSIVLGDLQTSLRLATQRAFHYVRFGLQYFFDILGKK